jgi:hypothetical protein
MHGTLKKHRGWNRAKNISWRQISLILLCFVHNHPSKN